MCYYICPVLINQPSIGQTFRRWRKEAGATQKEMAEKIGISIVYMNNLENGKFVPSLDIVEKIAQAHNKRLKLSVIDND